MDRAASLRDHIVNNLRVSRTHVMLAKAWLVEQVQEISRYPHADAGPVPHFRDRFLEEVSASPPAGITITRDDLIAGNFQSTEIDQLHEYLSWQTAFLEAVHDLIHSGFFVAGGAQQHLDEPACNVFEQLRHGQVNTLRLAFGELHFGFPRDIKVAPSWQTSDHFALSEGDLYLQSLGLPEDIHDEIADALRETAQCFRQQLLRPALAMLETAAEGAWTEMALSLADLARDGGMSDQNVQSFLTHVNDTNSGVMRKVIRIIDFYRSNQTELSALMRQCGVRQDHLTMVSVWTDQVRDSRNVLHFEHEPAIPNTHEKVACLMLGAGQYLRKLYAVRAGAQELLSSVITTS